MNRSEPLYQTICSDNKTYWSDFWKNCLDKSLDPPTPSPDPVSLGWQTPTMRPKGRPTKSPDETRLSVCCSLAGCNDKDGWMANMLATNHGKKCEASKEPDFPHFGKEGFRNFPNKTKGFNMRVGVF